MVDLSLFLCLLIPEFIKYGRLESLPHKKSQIKKDRQTGKSAPQIKMSLVGCRGNIRIDESNQ